LAIRALVDHALKAYSDADIYAPEKARATFLRSQILRMMRQPDKADTELQEATRLYEKVVGETAVRRPAEALAKEDFDELITFWSR
jgi:hypothetical protein